MPRNEVSTKDIEVSKTELTLHIYLKEMRTYIHTKTGMQMFNAALFIIDKNNPNVHQLENRSISGGIAV